ncbi:cell surface protein [Lachnospiraceae bacterium TWA4]|nr:cell surface protein [Lachnospiraceae bacterium TWA4]
MKEKRRTWIKLFFIMAVIGLFMSVKVEAGGELGSNLKCTFENGTLIIESDYIEKTSIPDDFSVWSSYEGRVTSVIITDSIDSIGDNSFSGCTTLKNVQISNSVRSIGMSAFADCTNLESITIPGSVKFIENEAFENCTKLKKVNFTEGLKGIGDNVFIDCSSLKSITIPESVVYIGASLFESDNLNSVIISNNRILTIDDEAFSFCPNLTIYSNLGSYAQGYAKEKNIPFKVIGEKDHNYKLIVQKANATTSSNGSVRKVCSFCESEEVATIYAPKSINLSKNTVSYTGKAIKPIITVVDKSNKTVDSSNYSVQYQNNTKVGTATVTVVFKGDKYTGSLKKTFKIVKAKPVIKVKTTSRTFKVSDLKKKSSKFFYWC